jgi:hypothetical protein
VSTVVRLSWLGRQSWGRAEGHMAYRVSHAWAWRVIRKGQQLSREGCMGTRTQACSILRGIEHTGQGRGRGVRRVEKGGLKREL